MIQSAYDALDVAEALHQADVARLMGGEPQRCPGCGYVLPKCDCEARYGRRGRRRPDG